MNKKREITEYDAMYKRLTKNQFVNMMENLRMLNCALAHLAFVCCKENDKESLVVPLMHHMEYTFQFQVLKNKSSEEEVLQIKIIDKPTLN